ncbi:ABC transporter permease [Streptomyces daliensis]
MSTVDARPTDPTGRTRPTQPTRRSAGGGTVARMKALARAELILLVRNKSALFTALALPVLITFAMKPTVDGMDLGGTGLSAGTVLLPAGIGYVLLFAVYSTLVGSFVTRREELVLKRLRTGELRDGEILAGAALPMVLIGATQCVLLLAGGAAVLGMNAPENPLAVALGVLLGMVMMVAMAAATTVITRTTESAQLSAMPLLLVSFAASGVLVPLSVLPDTVADVCAWLPVSPLMELVREGWSGGLDGAGMLRSVGVAVLWTALAGFAVRRWFRWEPRR